MVVCILACIYKGSVSPDGARWDVWRQQRRLGRAIATYGGALNQALKAKAELSADEIDVFF